MKIYVSRDYKKTLCMFIFYFTLFIGFFTFNFGVTSTILYICDALALFLMIISFRKITKAIMNKMVFLLFAPIFLLVLIGSLCAVFNGFNIGRWLWSIRNWGRLFAFFLIALVTLTKNDCDRICKFTINLYHVNVLVVLGQFLFFNNIYGRDSLNGVLGRDTSSVHLTLTLIVVAIATAQYISRHINWRKFFSIMLEVFIVAIIAELRVIPIIVIIMVALSYFSTFKITMRNVCRIAVFSGIIIVFVNSVIYMLKIFYPETALEYSLSGIISAASTKGGYGYTGGIDRLIFITVINERVFSTWRERLFGIGIGNAEYSVLSSLCSPFYHTYGKKLGYLNFSSAMIYIETGLTGLCLYCASYISVILGYFNMLRVSIRKKISSKDLFYMLFGGEIAIINVFYIIYNNLQRTDVAYLLGLYLAIAFVGIQKETWR